MSQPIQKMINVLKGKLRHETEKGVELYNEIQSKGETDDEALVNKLLSQVSRQIEKIEIYVESLTNENTRWLNYIQHLRDLNNEQAYQAEDELYTQFAGTLTDDPKSDFTTGITTPQAFDDGFISGLAKATILLDLLKDTKHDIKTALKSENTSSQQSSSLPTNMGAKINHPAVVNNITTTTGDSQVQMPGVRLPKITLMTFNGEFDKWQEYSEIFHHTVDSTNLPDVMKLTYLKGSLGPKVTSLDGLPVVGENYNKAMNILKKRYGDDHVIKESLFSKLKHLPKSDIKIYELRNTIDTIEKILNQLENKGVDVANNEMLIQEILSKFPYPVLSSLEDRREEEIWSMKDLREQLQKFILKKEKLARQCAEVRSPEKIKSPAENQQRQFTGRFGQRIASQPTGAFASTANRPCVFCSKLHFNDQCTEFNNCNSRFQRMRELGKCVVCFGEKHSTGKCPKAMTVECFHCKKKGHNRSFCREKFPGPTKVKEQVGAYAMAEVPIPSIKQDTDTVKKPMDDSKPEKETKIELKKISKSSNTTAPTVHQLLQNGRHVMLKTATAYIKNPARGDSILPVKILLDDGAQNTFIKMSVAKKLHLEGETEIMSCGSFGTDQFSTKETKAVSFQLFLADGSIMDVEANATEPITGNIHRAAITEQDLEQLQSLEQDHYFADIIPVKGETFQPDVLIGSDYYNDIIKWVEQPIKLPSGLHMVATHLGYVLCGKHMSKENMLFMSKTCGFVSMNPQMSIAPNINEIQFAQIKNPLLKEPDLSTFWNLESIGITDSPYTKDEDRAIEQFNNSVHYDPEEKRYHVKFIWKTDNPELDDNFGLAMGRFRSLTRRFERDQDLLETYNNIIQDQLSKNIIEKVVEKENPKHSVHYLPHHPIITPQKSTTKVRIVLDPSSKSNKNQKSLNENLYKGANLLPDLAGQLIRFGIKPIAIISDIEKAFLTIGLLMPDRDTTRFLWYKDPTKPKIENNVQVYRFCKLPFGPNCSPFILEITVKYHLKKDRSRVAELIAENIYVDNVVIGAFSLEEAKEYYTEAKRIFNAASMNLREWNSNCSEFKSFIPETDREEKERTKVLGLWWTLGTDSLHTNGLKPEYFEACTKRQVLQAVASLFDPLGWFTPITLHGKVFIQKLWSTHKTWDENLPHAMIQEWKFIAQQLSRISEVERLRYMGILPESEIDIMTYCDASKIAYGAVAFLRIKNVDETHMQFIISKQRLAPKSKCSTKENKIEENEPVSLPRLELLSVVLGTRLSKFVETELHLPVKQKFLWTDSQVCLRWIVSSKPLTTFVYNRITEIKNATNTVFHYIPTNQNPADVLTRGTTIEELNTNNLWWEGPTWASKNENEWPQFNIPEITPEILESLDSETKKNQHMMLLVTQSDVNPLIELDESRFSSLRKLLRVTVYVLRAAKSRWLTLTKERQQENGLMSGLYQNIQTSKSPVNATEIKTAQLFWDINVQRKALGSVIEAIKSKEPNNLVKSLRLFQDEYGVIRSQGRIDNSIWSYETKCPTLLPRGEYYTKLIIQELHQKLMHCGVSHTLAILRQQYWIPSGRCEVKKTLSKCIVCKKYQGGPFARPNFPFLPKERVTRSDPFQYCGFDYTGYFMVRLQKGLQPQKIWLCLFTCLATRAVHLEVIPDTTAEQFVNCLKQFISRRGKPDKMISDNQAAFKLGKNVFDLVWKQVFNDKNVLSYVAEEKIEFSFIPELSPWSGGFYERLIGSVKKAMRKCVGRKILTFDEFLTLAHETEAVINSRPLVYVHNDPESGYFLSPSSFLLPNRKCGTPELEPDTADPDYQLKYDSASSLINKWKSRQKELNAFWKLWSEDYLLSLRERAQINHKTPKIHSKNLPKIDEIVLVKEEGIPRGNWKLARIVEVCKNKNNIVRSVKLLLPSHNIIRRPVSLIYPLEIQVEQNDKQDKNNDDKYDDGSENNDNTKSCDIRQLQPRLAKEAAKRKISEYFKEQSNDLLFIMGNVGKVPSV